MPTRETYEQQDYSGQRPFDGECYECTFEGCDFTESDLGGVAFVDCTFEGCNLSMVDLDGTRLQGVEFAHCKLMGVDFSKCSEFALAVGFEECLLNYASFWRMKLPKTSFAGCSLVEVNFVEADLREAALTECDLSGASFDRTVLEEADLRGAYGFLIDPEGNRVEGAKFSRGALEGLLYKYGLEVE
jgi:uncharacterized protein YjbI with pentapeptide repeats